MNTIEDYIITKLFADGRSGSDDDCRAIAADCYEKFGRKVSPFAIRASYERAGLNVETELHI